MIAKSGKLITENYFDYLKEIMTKRDAINKNNSQTSNEKYKKNFKINRFIKSASQELIPSTFENQIKIDAIIKESENSRNILHESTMQRYPKSIVKIKNIFIVSNKYYCR